jgi:hypothetical protein
VRGEKFLQNMTTDLTSTENSSVAQEVADSTPALYGQRHDYVIHLQFDINAKSVEIRAIQSPKYSLM